jgi:hypothetical protein
VTYRYTLNGPRVAIRLYGEKTTKVVG